ncbi:MAG TPA: DUF4845 domain-containing protein [Rhodocyclaceae bacterium]|nr:DUF4845 domain-containing protein [Rhodocyclaceae bacterium]
MSIRYQRGLTLSGLLIAGILVALVVIVGMKVVPDVIEYAKIVSDIKALAQDPNLKQASPAEVRKAYERRAIVDHISAITPQDIDVVRDGSGLVLSFSYTKRITLFGPVSLLIDFEGSSEK